VAAHCLYAGLIEEGLAIVKGVRDRHDGEKRNPWDEFECGHHYARAMSSWSLLLALSGYHYDAGRQYLAFAPKINEADFRSFFSAGTAWGQFSQQREGDTYTAIFTVAWGELTLQTLSLSLPGANSVTVTLDNEEVGATVSPDGTIRFATSLTIGSNQVLRLHAD
jgi:non-lysosomal glucosylceramidase